MYSRCDLARHLFKVPTPNPNPKNTSMIKTEKIEKPINTASCSGKPCIALTFDDGPGAHTSRLLDILKQRNTKATFFVLGNKVARNTPLLQRMKSEGHGIANHSWSHANLSKLPANEIRSEIVRTNDAIKEATGESPIFLREPYGASNETVQSELRTLGMSSILWSVDTRDWADRDSTIVCHRATSNARSSAIILLHDIHTSSVDAVPCIIDNLTKQGYTLVTIHELLGKTNPGQKYYSG